MRPTQLLRAVTLTTATLAAALAVPSVAAASLWHLDERSGTKAVDSAGTNTGTLKNVLVGQLPAFSGTAYRFNGTSSIVLVPSSTTLNYAPSSPQFVYTAHVNFTQVPTAAVGDYDLLRKGFSSTAGGYYKMEIFPTPDHTQGRGLCQLRGASGTAKVTGGPNLATGTWHTVQCIVRPSSVSLVVDGATIATKAVAVGAITNTSRFTMGGKSTGGDWYKGLLDEVSVVG